MPSADEMYNELLGLLTPAKQEHVLRYWKELSEEQQQALYKQITVDIVPTLPEGAGFEHLNRVYAASNQLFIDSKTKGPDRDRIQPPKPSEVMHQSSDADVTSAQRQNLGFKAIREKKCAVVILAGGAGTRLGQSYPKGMLVCPLLKQQKSLFQMNCEKIRRAEVIAGADAGSIQLCFMTSEQTDADTREFFKAHNNFGLLDSQLTFTVQSSLPCFIETEDQNMGKIILADKHKIAMAPGGNAGIYEALSRGGILTHFEKAGSNYVQIFTVDNILARVGDPQFFGIAAETGAECLVKSCPKASDNEAVGVFAKKDGKWGVVEYTEIGDEMAATKDPETGLRMFNAANIAIHLCTLDFLKLIAEKMNTFYVYHIAKKPIPTVIAEDAVQGKVNESDKKLPGVKMEAFIFDLFQFVSSEEKFVIVEVDRTVEFSAIKNADDPNKRDSPTTAVKDLQRLHFNWLLRAARKADGDDNALFKDIDAKALDELVASKNTDGIVEISPLASYGGENLIEYISPFLDRVKKVVADGAERKDVDLLIIRSELERQQQQQ